MEKEKRHIEQYEFNTESNYWHLITAILKRNRNAFKGTRFQFIRNHPQFRRALENWHLSD